VVAFVVDLTGVALLVGVAFFLVDFLFSLD